MVIISPHDHCNKQTNDRNRKKKSIWFCLFIIAFSTFLNLSQKINAKRVIVEYLNKLQRIYEILSEQETIHLYSSSILLTYDCEQLTSDVSSYNFLTSPIFYLRKYKESFTNFFINSGCSLIMGKSTHDWLCSYLHRSKPWNWPWP